MRCWVFDVAYEKIGMPGGRASFPRRLEIAMPGRRWVCDDPSNPGTVWVLSSGEVVESMALIQGQSTSAHEEADVRAAIEVLWPGVSVARGRLPGERHPRIWRGSYSTPPSEEVEAFLGTLASASLCFDRFRQVLRTIEPEPANGQTYGHDLRQLIVLAATEVESAWRSILVANHYRSRGSDRFSTKDYWKLRDPLKLDQWEVALTMAPRFGPVVPFRKWEQDRPTESLGWYDAYNRTKHDREGHLSQATLTHLIGLDPIRWTG